MVTRASDEPHIPSDIHHWMSSLESQIATAHGGLTKLSTDVTDMRLVMARMDGRSGSLSSGTARWLAGLTLAAVAQVGAALYWGGEVRALLKVTSSDASRSLSLIEEHLRASGMLVERVSVIERRNVIADQNWARLSAKGMLK